MSSPAIVSQKYMTLHEVFEAINNDVSLLGTTFKFAGRRSALSRLFDYAFCKSHRWLLPPGTPPFNQSKYKPGTEPCNILSEIHKGYFDYFWSNSVKKAKREDMFIRTLENIDYDDALVIIAIKDQEITKLYPNITTEVLVKYNYINANDASFDPNAENISADEIDVDSLPPLVPPTPTEGAKKAAPKRSTTKRTRISKTNSTTAVKRTTTKDKISQE